MNTLKYLFAVAFIVCLNSCQNSIERDPNKTYTLFRTPDLNENMGAVTQSILKSGNDVLILNGDTLKTFSFFKNLILTNGKTNFTEFGRLNDRGDSLYKLLKNSRQFGLYEEHYHLKKIDSILPFLFFKEDSTFNVYNISRLEFLLLDGYYRMGAHVNKGRCNPKTFLPEWNPNKLDSNWNTILTEGHQEKKYKQSIEKLEPKHPGYQLLMKEFRLFLKENKNKNWDSIKVSSSKDSASLRKKIVKRLEELGYYDTSSSESSEKKFKNALIDYQEKNKIKADGKLGRTTLQLLKNSKEKTIRMMEMSIERWRWENSVFPERYFWINIPAAELKIFEKDENGTDTIVLQSNVVVGKPLSPTPQLSSTLNYFTIYPYWNVPPSIAVNELLPKVKADTSYLGKKNFDVLNSKGEVLNPASIDWGKINSGNFNIRFRQRIGADNSLGIMVFNFANPYNVYLHDTNSKSYFKSSNRFQSHGCIRLEKFVETAKFLIRDDTLKLPYDTLTSYLATPFQRRISFKKKVPIYIRYFTHVADAEGGIFRYADIYGKDEDLIKAIYQPIP